MDTRRILLGFAAGALAVPLFHQTALFLLHAAGIGPAAWNVAPVPPLGVPALLSAAFWGGLWGIVLALVEPRFPRGGAYWPAALAFGAVLPTLVVYLVVLPLKGVPLGAALGWPGIIIGPVVNGAWGVGTALLLRAFAGRRGERLATA
jgi:hypothetical protein